MTHEVTVKMSLELLSSEGLTGTGESFKMVYLRTGKLVLTVDRRPLFLLDLSIRRLQCPHNKAADFP